MSAEQTPDIEATLAEHLHCTHDGGDHLITWTCGMTSEPYQGFGWREQHIAEALAPVLAAAVREAEQRAPAATADGPGWFWTQDEWAEWSNELAILIPEDDVDRYSNPDGAQESVIKDCLRAYIAERERRARPAPPPTCSDPACPIYERHRQQGKTFPLHGPHDYRAADRVAVDAPEGGEG